MPLHLVGETTGKARAHYQAKAGKWVHLMRGIYLDDGDDIDQAVHRHAIRIARYLYPRTYLAAASAVLLGPTADGRLFLSGRRNQRTRLRSLEIIQNQAPEHPSVVDAIVDDGMGEFGIAVSSMRQRFLEAFRMRSEHAASMDDSMRQSIAERLVDEFGDAGAAAHPLWALARKNQWYREGKLAERYLLRCPIAAPLRNEAALDLIVAWHGLPVGNLMHDGLEWSWRSTSWDGPPVVRQPAPGKLPPFIRSLLPEGWLERVLDNRDERAALRTGKRYLSNITILESQSELLVPPADILTAQLASFTQNGSFFGRYEGPGRGDTQQEFEHNLAQLYAHAQMPRIPGIQVKAPMHLDCKGALIPATTLPFTHILKPAVTGVFEALPVIEWQALGLAAAAGFEVPQFALVAMPDGMPPALLVERFDIRTIPNDQRFKAMEDFASVLGMPPEDKYDSTIERVMKAIRPLSTEPCTDILKVLKRALFAWLIADGDMHLKNLALLKIAEPGARQFGSVRLAPLYDAVTTRVFPGLKTDRMALKLNGKDDRLRRADFRIVAGNAGILAADAEAAFDEVASGIHVGLERMNLPGIVLGHPPVAEAAERMRSIVSKQLDGFA